MQRARIIAAMVEIVDEHGYAATSVSAVSLRAKVSRRRFYEVFESLEDCFLVVLDEGTLRVGTLISQAFDREHGTWVDGVRAALASLLAFFDAEPIHARVLLVEASAAGAWAREHRERHLLALTLLIEKLAGEPEGGHPHPHFTAGVMAALLGVLHTHLVTGRKEPLVTLLGSLMGLVTAPYLDRRSVRREILRGEELARELLAQYEHDGSQVGADGDAIPGWLLDPRAHRARACLCYLAERSGVSNRQVAEAVGVTGRTQMSALLARLHRAGLLTKWPSRTGGPNAWSLTQHGVRVAHAVMGDHGNTDILTFSTPSGRKCGAYIGPRRR